MRRRESRLTAPARASNADIGHQGRPSARHLCRATFTTELADSLGQMRKALDIRPGVESARCVAGML